MVNYEAEIKLVFLPFLWIFHICKSNQWRGSLSFHFLIPCLLPNSCVLFLSFLLDFIPVSTPVSLFLNSSKFSLFLRLVTCLTCWELLSKIWFPLMIQKLFLFPNLLSFNWVQFDLTLDRQRREKVDERKERKMERMECFLFLTSFDILKCFSRISSWKIVRFLGSVRMVSYTEKYLLSSATVVFQESFP